MSNPNSEGIDAVRTDDLSEARPLATPLILCVDSASDARCVAVARGAKVFARSGGGEVKGHSSVLLSDIDSALKAAGVALAEIELLAVVNGPGSFTGLRAGLATVKAFATVSDRPVAPVPTLHAVALSAGASARTVAMVPAGRGEVFAQTLRVSDEGRVVELDAPVHVPPSWLVERAAGQFGGITWAGGGARTHVELIREAAAREKINLLEGDWGGARESSGDARVWRLARAVNDYASEIARLSLISFIDAATVRPQDLRALYVRASDAELKEQCPR
jgi:tRNA threonylcarbamoyladenosine biosynthesis protein TsaB